jgi:heterodisulfide reductase subunit B
MPINYSKYPPNWLTEIRPRILHRANNRCEFCGIENYTVNSKGTKVILTIAHLDHDSSNHQVQDDRLAALCQACHLGYDRWRHILKRKYGMAIFEQPTLFP